VRYQFIRQMGGQLNIRALCRVMEVSSSGYYAWRDRPVSARACEETLLVAQIRTVHQQSRKRYGSPRIYKALRAQGVSCGSNRVARLMRKHGVVAKHRRRFRHTTIVNPTDQWYRDVLDRVFTPERPNAVWASDITYLRTKEGWLYLAVVLDLYSRKVVGWAAQPYITTDLVLEAMSTAIQLRRPPAGLIHHSDRGTQYASKDYQKLLRQYEMISSMSEKGDCWDNAPVESYFSTLKNEIDDLSSMTRAEAWQTLFEFIEIWYNRQRIHSTIGYVSPAQYEANVVQASKA
jgi:putative transposase